MNQLDILFVMLSVALGLVGWGLHLFFILIAYSSKERWTVFIDYNQFKEGYIELVVFFILVIFYIVMIFYFIGRG